MRLLFACLMFTVFCCDAVEKISPISIALPMRDGVTLPTDLYLPTPDAKNLPCILLRAPNGRLSQSSPSELAKHGYVVAIQDTRSRIDSQGKTMPYLADGWGELQDGYDTIQWLANSEYTNGKIGTMGVSAQGITQLLLAPTAPPNLICQHIGVAASSIFDQGMFAGGQLRKNQVEQWLNYHAPHPSVLLEVVSQPLYNQFWANFDTCKRAGGVRVPAVHIGGWFDTFCQGTIDAFVSRQEYGGEGAKGRQKMVIGPWTHFWPEVKSLGEYEVPKQAEEIPTDFSALAWFNYHLKGEPNHIAKTPAVTYYVMGPFDGSPSSGNVWRTSDKWPPSACETSLYLAGQGALSFTSVEAGRAIFSYDPSKPCPTLGGRNLFIRSGPVDQRAIETRKDVVCFTTEILKEDLEVTGHIMAYIYFTTDAEDTDVVVRLMDVYPDGRSVLITDGIRRLSDLSPHKIDKTVEPKEVAVDLWSTSFVFAKGHRIRVSISGSNYPRYERSTNLLRENSAVEPYPIANNVIYFGGIKRSRIVLPVVPIQKNESDQKPK